jgi:hypothetical protein
MELVNAAFREKDIIEHPSMASRVPELSPLYRRPQVYENDRIQFGKNATDIVQRCSGRFK